MALIPCPECGRMVSPNAEECPGCGAPLKELLSRPAEEKNAPHPIDNAPIKKRGNGVVWICVAVLAVAAVVVLFLGLNREKILSAVLGALVAFGAWGVFGVFKDVSDAKKEIKNSGAGEYMKASYQFGFFVLIIGIAAVIGAIVLISMNSKKNAPAAQQ